ncbi:MAG: DUF4041 domain-containing protein [Bacteroidia bacterium]|nr:DUF4041 domain-containing protein [Bacteroidia bacterium]
MGSNTNLFSKLTQEINSHRNRYFVLGGSLITLFGCFLIIAISLFSPMPNADETISFATPIFFLIAVAFLCLGIFIAIVGGISGIVSFLKNRNANKTGTSSVKISIQNTNEHEDNIASQPSPVQVGVSAQVWQEEIKASFVDIFHIKEIKTELVQALAERDFLKNALADTDKMEYYQLKQAIEDLTFQKQKALNEAQSIQAELENQKQGFDQQIVELNKQIELKKKDIIVLEDEELLQSFGFYNPHYDFQNSEMYKAKLQEIRDKQKMLVKSGKATILPTNFTFNNSRTEANKVIKDYVKLILRSFNNECDASIINVKFNNVYVIKRKIEKAFDTLNNLGKRMNISIVQTHLSLKLEEMYLYYEYQVKKQEEKEEQKLIREQMREEAKLIKEIEDMKAKIEREERHFSKALENIDAQLGQVESENERGLLEKERENITQKMQVLEKDKLDVYNREQNTRAGYVYVISNLGAFGENIYKIGVTRRFDPTERVYELGDASVPFRFDTHAMIFSDDAPALENALHKTFESRRLNMVNRRREFFHVTLDEIEKVVKTNFSKPVEFIKIAEAAEYRESLMLKKATLSQ